MRPAMVGGRGPALKLLCSSVRSEASASLVRHKIGTVPELPPWAQKARQIPRSVPTPRAGTRPSRGRKNHAGSLFPERGPLEEIDDADLDGYLAGPATRWIAKPRWIDIPII
jgi:hypothetical protein